MGTADPEEAARRLLDHGVELALVKKGAEGVLVATREGVSTVAPQLVDVVCGLGAGDAFGGALVHGLLSGWYRCGSPSTATPPARSSSPSWPVPTPCPPSRSSRRWSPGGGSRHERRPRRTTRQHHAPGRSPMMPQQISDEQWRQLLETRATRPEAVAEAYANRKRPEGLLSERGTIFLVAADHPARGALASGADAMAMADRRGLLERLMTALSRPGVDGALGSPTSSRSCSCSAGSRARSSWAR